MLPHIVKEIRLVHTRRVLELVPGWLNTDYDVARLSKTVPNLSAGVERDKNDDLTSLLSVHNV